ncbi:PAAR domain-containing protein [Paraburkholderia sp. DD10]|uniref:PAAR domain-containing protein n=1 Tax=Paraburkholderia sp. DD10 TaxID=3409691 RepID=UPI00346D96DB
MSYAFIREGDQTSHGGTVLNSGAITVVDGRPIAFVGTMVSCPKCGGIFPIVTSKNPGMSFSGRRAAFEGDKTACGANLMPSQALSAANVPTGAGATARSLTAGHQVDESMQSYRGRFQVLDQDTGQPVSGHSYSLRLADGQEVSGTTDANGYTQWHEAAKPASLVFGPSTAS